MASKLNGEKLTSRQVAQMIGVAEGTLRNWRTQELGPKYHTLHEKRRRKGKGSKPRVYYKPHEVAEWLKGGE